MKIQGTNISMIRGDSESLTVRCRQLPFERGDTIYLTVREDAESEIAMQKVVTEFDEEGRAVIGIEHGDTEGMETGDYVYDVQLTRADGTVTTLVPISRFRLTEEVTY